MTLNLTISIEYFRQIDILCPLVVLSWKYLVTHYRETVATLKNETFELTKGRFCWEKDRMLLKDAIIAVDFHDDLWHCRLSIFYFARWTSLILVCWCTSPSLASRHSGQHQEGPTPCASSSAHLWLQPGRTTSHPRGVSTDSQLGDLSRLGTSRMAQYVPSEDMAVLRYVDEPSVQGNHPAHRSRRHRY